MFYVTGDIHGNPRDIIAFANSHNLTEKDTIIILGDAGFNYFLSRRDKHNKEKISKLKCTVFCIAGNHEAKPWMVRKIEDGIESFFYDTKVWNDGVVFFEKKYPNLLFADSGEIYNLDGKKCIVLGGAYSVDKYYRITKYLINRPDRALEILSKLGTNDISDFIESKAIPFVNHGIDDENRTVQRQLDTIATKLNYGEAGWFWDEQISDIEMHRAEENLVENKIDIVFSHTCPAKYKPIEMFLPQVKQDTVDDSMEQWLDTIEEKIDYEKWYCGHWHTDKKIDKMIFLFNLCVKL